MLFWEDKKKKQILISSVEGDKKNKNKEVPLVIIFSRSTFLLEAVFHSPFLRSPLQKQSSGKYSAVPMEIGGRSADFKEEYVLHYMCKWPT